MILWRVFVFLPGFLSSLLQLMPCCVWMPLCAWACSHASSQRRGLFPGKTFCCCCEYPCRELRINFANLLGPFLLLNLYAACGPFSPPAAEALSFASPVVTLAHCLPP